ncbi:MAG: hypothetical protein ACLURP_02625 [Ruminococcus sp.]
MEFTNTYTTSGQIALGATKTLDGQTLEARAVQLPGNRNGCRWKGSRKWLQRNCEEC